MLEVKRRDGESFESLLRRFGKKVVQSGKILEVKKGKFYAKPKSKRQIKEAAQRRETIRTEREYLRKIGKLDEVLEAAAKKRRGGRR